MSNDRFNNDPEHASMAMRGSFLYAYEACQCVRLLNTIISIDETKHKSNPALATQRKAVLMIAKKLVKEYAETQVHAVTDANEWHTILLGVDDDNASE